MLLRVVFQHLLSVGSFGMHESMPAMGMHAETSKAQTKCSAYNSLYNFFCIAMNTAFFFNEVGITH